ncbi:MAG: hypothetical protein ACO3MG_08140 [Saprospiraceae bacterium]
MKLIAITGMHRSNTSALGKVFYEAGYNMGDTLMPPSKANPRGYFEDVDIINFEERLIEKICGTQFRFWYIDKDVKLDLSVLSEEDYTEAKDLILSKVGHSDHFIWKSPRSALLLNFWRKLFPELGVIILYRHYDLVANSLVRRGDMWKFSKLRYLQKRKALNIWYKYNLELLMYYASNKETCLLFKSPNVFLEEHWQHDLNAFLNQRLAGSFKKLTLKDNFDPNLLKLNIPNKGIIGRLVHRKFESLYNELNKLKGI